MSSTSLSFYMVFFIFTITFVLEVTDLQAHSNLYGAWSPVIMPLLGAGAAVAYIAHVTQHRNSRHGYALTYH